MTTTTTTVSTATTSGPGPAAIAYRPGASAEAPDLLHYAVISVQGRLSIMAATTDDAPVHSLHRRTASGRVWRFPLEEGITAWLSGDSGAPNPAATQVTWNLTEPGDQDEPYELLGQVVFTGTEDTHPIGLTARQVQLLRRSHAQAAHWSAG